MLELLRHKILAPAMVAALTTILNSGCGSTGASKCPDADPTKPPECPICAPTPRPGPAPIAIGADTMSIDREQRVSLVALSQYGTTALVRIEDELVGDLFKTVDLRVTPVPKLVQTWLFQSLTETVARRQALRTLKVAAGPMSQTNAAGVTLVASDAGDHVVVLAMKGDRAVPIATLPRLRDADGLASDVSVIKLAWDPTGQRALVIHEQRLAAAPGFEGQWLHVLNVDPASLPF